MGLLRHVRRRVVTGECVLGKQQTGQKHIEGHVESAEVDELREDVAGVVVILRKQEQHSDDEQHTRDMPPDRDVVQQRHELDAKCVEQAMDEQHDAVDEDHCRGRRWIVEDLIEPEVGEKGEAEVDPGGDGDLAQQIEPPGEPAPPGAVLAAELGSPVVEAAGRRVAGAHLGHREPDQRDHDPDERPAEGHHGRTAVAHAEIEEGQTAGEDRDDRERHGEVREGAHPPPQLLRVAEPVQGFDVGTLSLNGHLDAPPL